MDCQSYLKTNSFAINDPNAIINVIHWAEHTHPPEKDRIQRRLAINEMRERIWENPTVPVKRAYEQVLVTMLV